MKDGFTGYGNNSDERVSFMKVVGYYWSNVIPATTITYIMKFDFELQNQNIKPSSLSKRFSEKLYLNEELSDVKIICEDKVFDCHKLILRDHPFKTSACLRWGGGVPIADVCRC